MTHSKRKASRTGATGENLVCIALMQYLEWTPRKEELDDGVDFNVEVPADHRHPARRFLAQVKTRSEFVDRKGGSWTITIKDDVIAKYRSSREPVFLFAVDLKRNQIRWLNLFAVLKANSELKTFTLPSANTLDSESASELRSSVFAAFDEADDQFHPPLQALRYRERKYEELNPGLTVKGAIIGGQEQYEFGLREGTALRVTVRTRTETSAKALQQAYEFGSRAEVTVRSEDITGLPSLQLPRQGESTLRIEPISKRVRLGLTSRPSDGSSPLMLELDAELARGTIGWEVRSADSTCPFDFRAPVSDQESEGHFSLNWNDRPWKGQPFSRLPGLVPLQKLAAMISQSGTLTFYAIEHGERHPMMSLIVDPEPDSGLKETVATIDFFGQLADLCRSLGFNAVFRTEDGLTEKQLRDLELAFQLLKNSPIPFNGYRYSITLTEEGVRALRESAQVPMSLQMTLGLNYGETPLGCMPIRSNIRKHVITNTSEGTFTLEAIEADLMWDRQEQKIQL